MSITLARVKSNEFLDIEDKTEFDVALTNIITDVVSSAIEYMDNADITKTSHMSNGLQRQLCKQVSYEFRRRKDPGLTSVTSPDGSISKFSIDEWLKSVKKVLDRNADLNV